jgi:hypothetical protein
MNFILYERISIMNSSVINGKSCNGLNEYLGRMDDGG